MFQLISFSFDRPNRAVYKANYAHRNMLLNKLNLVSLKLAEKVSKDENPNRPNAGFFITPSGTYIRSHQFIVFTSFVDASESDFPEVLGDEPEEIQSMAIVADSLRDLVTYPDNSDQPNIWLDDAAIITKVENVKETEGLIESEKQLVEVASYNPHLASKFSVTATAMSIDVDESNRTVDYLLDDFNYNLLAEFKINGINLKKVLEDLIKMNLEVKVRVATKSNGDIVLLLDTQNMNQEKSAIVISSLTILPKTNKTE
ncbi:MAG: hypothetical protein OHK0017_08210 [Patescibacteria group bacterium]